MCPQALEGGGGWGGGRYMPVRMVASQSKIIIFAKLHFVCAGLCFLLLFTCFFQKLSPFIFMHPFRITFTINPSVQILLYIYIQIYLEINLPLYHDAFLPADSEKPTCRLNYSFTCAIDAPALQPTRSF